MDPLVLYVAQQVQSDHDISTENLQVELRDLDNRLEAMEQRGIELERNLRDCKNGSPNCSYQLNCFCECGVHKF